MRWHDLLFAHWPVRARALESLLPSGLALDTFDGEAWVGVVPFRMSGVRPRVVPALPGLSAFPELNVRTYVTLDDRPGVWFFSLDVTKRLARDVARWRFHLPYRLARMKVEADGERVRYASDCREAQGELAIEYRPTAPARTAEPGSLDAWLTERYCLYSADRRGRLFRGEILHAPWPLCPAEAEIRANTMATGHGIALPQVEPRLLFARELDVVAWSLDGRAADLHSV